MLAGGFEELLCLFILMTLTCFLTLLLLSLLQIRHELNSTLLDSSTENGGVCTNQPGDAASVATGGGGSVRPPSKQ